jgi:acyl phosphate:glycerol-3-phosphate acyltransferase
VARWLARGESAEKVLHLAILAGLCAILGHIFPVWLRFKGGKGVATAFGVFVALSPLAALASFLLWLAIMLLTKYVSLASILGAAVLPVLTLWLSPVRYGLAWGTLMFLCAAIVIVKHRENMQRLIAGTEHGFGARKTSA